MLKEEKKTCNK